jgi:hypothetical protein
MFSTFLFSTFPHHTHQRSTFFRKTDNYQFSSIYLFLKTHIIIIMPPKKPETQSSYAIGSTKIHLLRTVLFQEGDRGFHGCRREQVEISEILKS